jgi:hypothetical protein
MTGTFASPHDCRPPILITTLSQLNVLEQLLRSVLLFEEKREKDIVNESDIQLLADLLPEELLNEARHLCSLSRGLSIFDDYLLYQIKFMNKKNAS